MTPAPGLDLIHPVPTLPPMAPSSGLPRETINVMGSVAFVEYTPLDSGRIQDAFDGQDESIARTANAKVAVVDITFVAPRKMARVDVTTGTMDAGLRVLLTVEGQKEPIEKSMQFRNQHPDPAMGIDFGGPFEVRRLRLEIEDLNHGDGHIHIREIRIH